MAQFRHRNLVILLTATTSVAVTFAACTDSYRGNATSGTGTGPGGGTGSGGDGGSGGDILGDGDICEETCSNDLKAVINCKGTVITQCPADKGCANAKCEYLPCEAAEISKSSYGCDYWALKTPLLPAASAACFAGIVANTWGLPVQLHVERDGQPLPVQNFAYIPEGQGQPQNINYIPYDPAVGLESGKVAVLFLSRRSLGGGIIDCPAPGAMDVQTGVTGTGRGSAFHITTDYPVVAYQMVPFGGGQAGVTSATLLLPTSAWDVNYLAINPHGSSEPDLPGGFPSLDIVAYQDATDVTILPKVAIEGNGGNVAASPANTSVTYTLNAGEFLQLSQSAELTGSPIKSTKPIGVFGAHPCMLVPNASVTDCDSAQQQIAPVRATGNEYVAVRYRDRVAGANETPPWRIVGMVDGTMLTWKPTKPAGAPETIDLGEVVEFAAGDPFVVRSQSIDNPFYLGGYMTGGQPYGTIGDPDWVNVIPPAQYLNNYVFFTDPTYPETSLVLVRTPSKVDGSFAPVDLDCTGPIEDGWVDVDDKYQYTRIDLTTGNFQGVGGCANGRHEIKSDLPFGVTVWGWGAVQQSFNVSYGYPAGAGFLPINEVDIPPMPE